MKYKEIDEGLLDEGEKRAWYLYFPDHITNVYSEIHEGYLYLDSLVNTFFLEVVEGIGVDRQELMEVVNFIRQLEEERDGLTERTIMARGGGSPRS